jgi:hypothetical protein
VLGDDQEYRVSFGGEKYPDGGELGNKNKSHPNAPISF